MDSIWLSWSRLRTHSECRQKGFLKKTTSYDSPSNERNFTPGNISDRVVRDWLMNDPWNNLHVMPDMVPEYLDKVEAASKAKGNFVSWKSATDKDEIIQDCILAVTRLQPTLEKYVLPFEYTADYAFQSPVTVEVTGHGEAQMMLNGYMDILVKQSEDTYFIFDVKHTKNKYYWKSTIGQLAFYDTALRLAEGHYSRYSALLQPLVEDEPIKSFDIGNDDRMKMMQSIANYAEDVMNEDYAPTKNTSMCSMCDVKNSCIRFKPKMVNGKRSFSLG